MFAILLPIKFPTAIPGWGGVDKIDFKLVVNSGMVVPSATVQLVIMNWEIFVFFAKRTIFSIKKN